VIRERDGKYQVRVWVRDPETGKRKQLGRTATTMAEARRVERQLLNERDASFGQGASTQTVGEYFTRWIHDVIEAYRSAGTYEAWESVVRLRILPHRIARLKLSVLSPGDVQAWLASMARLGVSGRTQHKYFECLHAALEDALRLGKIPRNPASLVERPRQQKREPTVWSPGQARLFLQACAADQSRCAAVLAIMVHTGCRVEEVCQLEEGHFDEAAMTLTIPKGKTQAAARIIPLPAEAVGIIQRAQKAQEAERTGWAPEALFQEHWLFRQPTGHRWYERRVWYHFDRIRRQLGLPYARPHDLRHYFGTAAKQMGIPTRDIAAVMGHANTSVTENTYQHVNTAAARAVTEHVASTLRDDWDVCPMCHGTGRTSKKGRGA